MRKVKKLACIRRIIAYFMVIAMVFSTVDSTALYTYAAEEPDANIATVSEGGTTDGEENNYTGIEFTEDWGDREVSGFEISAWEMDENADFEAEALTILGGLDKTYDIVSLCYRSLADEVSKDLWNVAVAVTDAGNKDYEQIRVNFGSGSEVSDENWCFNNVMETEEAYNQNINLAIDYTISTENGGGVTVQLDGEALGLSAFADNVNLCLCTDSTNKPDSYSAFQTALGTESKALEVQGDDGYSVSTGYYSVDTYEDNSYINVDIQEMNNIVSGTTYQVVEAIYKGVIDDSEENFRSLYINYNEAGVDSLDEETILGILAYYTEAGMTFDAISITNPETETLVIDKDIVNAAAVLFNEPDGAERPLSFNFRNEENGTFKSWSLINPTADQTEDQTVSSSLTISDENKVEVQASECNFSAQKYQFEIIYDSKHTYYEKLREIFPFEENMGHLLEVGNDVTEGLFVAYSWQVNIGIYIDSDTVWSAEQTYEVIAPPYNGIEFVEDWDGNEVSGLEISAWDLDEDADFEVEALSVLNALEKTYDIIVLNYGYGSGEVSKDLWNAAVAATDADNKDYEEIRISQENESTFMYETWEFKDVAAITTEETQTINLSVEYAFSEESNGGATFKINESVTDLTLLADNSNVRIGTDYNYFQEGYNAVQLAFGTKEKDLEVKDSDGNVVIDGVYDTHSDDENSYVNVNVYEVQNLTAGVTYSVVEATYRGHYNSITEEGGYEFEWLDLYPGYIDKTYFTVDEITSILNNYEEKSFDEINVTYPSESMSGTISKDIMNALIPYLKDNTENRDNALNFLFNDESKETHMGWHICNPQVQDSDIEFPTLFTITDEKVTITTGSQLPKSDYVSVTLYINREQNETAAKLEEIFGTGDVSLLIGEIEDSAHINGDEVDLWIDLYDVNQLEANTTYEITKYQYKGTEFTEEWNDPVLSGFEIALWNMEENADFEAEALSILSGLEKTYDVIVLTGGEQGNPISKELWNAAVAATDAENKTYEQIRLNFMNSSTQKSENWCLENVYAVAEEVQTVNMGINYTISEENNGGATIWLEEGATGFSDYAERVNVNIGSDINYNTDFYTVIQTAFGTESKDLEVCDSNGDVVTDGIYDVFSDDTNSYANIIINGMQNLNLGVTYTISEKVYKGDHNYWIDDEGYVSDNLYIDPINIGKESFEVEDVINILSYYDEKFFDEITIVYNAENTTVAVNKDVINALLAYLKDSTEERASLIRISVRNIYTDITYEWSLVNPKEQEEDQTLTCTFNIGEENADISFGSQTLKADCINFNIDFVREMCPDIVNTLEGMYGTGWVWLSVEGTDCWADMNGTDWSVWISIEDINQLTADTTYSILPYEYIGSINTWDDGTRELIIYYTEDRGEAFTEEQLLSILDNYSTGHGLGDIFICQPKSETNIIYKSVADKACDLLANSGTVRFCFEDPNTGEYEKWYLYNVNPETEQITDQTVNAELIMNESDNSIYVSVGEQALVAESVAFVIGDSCKNDNGTADKFIKNIFGEENKEIETENGEIAGYYSVNEWNVELEFYEPNVLTSGQRYKVIPKAYRGDVDEYEDNGQIVNSLYIDSSGINASAFTQESFRTTIQYYIDNDIKFDHIFIEQKYSANNIIKKELINAAREIMKESDTSTIDFGFCGCTGEEYDENGNITQEFIQSDMIWELQNPGYASSDIDANVSLIGKWGEGVSVVLNENTYNVGNINLNFNLSQKSRIYKDILVPVYGEATYEEAGPLVVLENASDLRTDIGAFYNLNPDNDLVSFYLCCIQDWAQSVDNRLVKCDYTDIVIPVGQSVEISFANVPDANTLNAVSLTPDIISVAKSEKVVEIIALQAGEQGYFMATYQIDGKDYIELVSVYTSLESVIAIPEIPEINAVPGVEQTLADINLNQLVFGEGEAVGNFEWVDVTTELEPLADVDFHTFGAIYTDKDGNKANINVIVNMIRAEEISLYKGIKSGDEVITENLDGTTMKVGDELIIGTEVYFNNSAIGSYLESGKVLLRWTSKETLTDAVEYFGKIDVPRKYKATEKGKKEFTLSVVCAKTGKVLLSKSATVNVSGTDLFSFDSADFEFVDVVDEKDPMKGTYTFQISADNYAIAKKITVKSGDTSVLKLDKAVVTKEEGKPVKIEVGYTFKKYGKTAITVTAADEMKSSISYTCERVDYEPKILETSFVIDKTWKTEMGAASKLTIAYQRDTYPGDVIGISGDSASKFAVENGYLVLKDNTLKAGTYDLTIEMPVQLEGANTLQLYKKAIKVKVSESKVKAKVKQTKKVNEFYTLSSDSADGTGMININSGKSVLADAYISGENAVFTLTRVDNTNNFVLSLKEGVNLEGKALTDSQKKVTVVSVLEKDDASCNVSTSFTVKTENKAPSLVLSNKSDTLYPSIGYISTDFTVLNKTTKEAYAINDVKLVLNKQTGETYALKDTTEEPIKVGKNNYTVYTTGSAIGISLVKKDCVKATDKFIFRVQLPNWSKAVDVTYSAKVDLKVPKIKLSNKKLTLNVNEDIYKYQTGRTKVEVTGFKNLPAFDEIKVTGADDKFNFDYDAQNAILTVTFKDKVTPGSYKCKVETKILDQKITTDLTVKVVDKNLSKALKVVKKGSIDVLRRETTMITMNPKLSNLSGEIIDFELKGPDAEMFDAYYDVETGNCVVRARSFYYPDGSQEFNYSTKYNYRITPVYVLADNGVYVVEGTQQKVKLTQSKPKVSVSSDSTILYADKGNNMKISFNAVSKNEEIAIKEVRLLNYTNDLYWNSETGELGAYDNVNEMKKANGKYTLKFAVVYTDKAGNEKTAQTSYKVTIVR